MLVAEPPSPNPNVIAWAREQSGLPPARVAKRLQVKDPQVVEAWEQGRKAPTVRQTIKLAQLYHRPLSVFYQPEPPREAPLAREYRRLPNVTPGQESPELRQAIRNMLARQEIAAELYEELDYDVPEFTLSAHPSEDPQGVGERIRAAVGINADRQSAWRDEWQAWREWRAAIEDSGVLVFMFPNVEMKEVRGLALLRSPLPVIAVNTKENAGSRVFTALHELVHLMLANANEESAALTDRHSGTAWQDLERFAEAVASHALMPERDIAALFRQLESRKSPYVDFQAVASHFHVSPLAAATRLATSGRWSWPKYRAWRKEHDQVIAATTAKKSGFATPVQKSLGRGGQNYAQLVLEAFDTHRITTLDAARYLQLRPDQFDGLRSRLTRCSASESLDE